MASAYAALSSLAHTVEQLQIQRQIHPSLDQLHTNQLNFKTLSQGISFFLDFFEKSNCSAYDHSFESQVAHTAQTVEDLIESHIADQILNKHHQNTRQAIHEGVQTALQRMDLLREEAVMGLKEFDEHSRTTLLLSPPSPPPTVFPSEEENPSTVVGLDDDVTTLMEKLIQPHESNRRVITISGMGGIGKTTLARKLHDQSYMAYHFDIRTWATISKNYTAKHILVQLVSRLKFLEGDDDFSRMSANDLGLKLYKFLSGRRYLIVLDDMWDVGAWDGVRSFFPASKGSGVVITTRELRVASLGFYAHGMRLLDERESWDLLRSKAFGKDDDDPCRPNELDEIGRRISKNCKGLPLSIVVIGGHLAKSPRTREYWSYIAEGLNPLVKLDDYERCLRILSMSYVNLPIHLKPCFLYVGTFREDEKIRVSRLVRLWVAEGFLKKVEGNSQEETAEKCVRDLIGRNLISAHATRPTGKIKYCKIHDLLRDLCLKEARERKFLYVAEEESLQLTVEEKRRVVVRGKMLEDEERHHHSHVAAWDKATVLRTLVYHGTLPSLDNLKLLRLLRSSYVRHGQPECASCGIYRL